MNDVGHARPPVPDARFRAGSNTKAFVATVVLQLVAEGRLDLDAAVATYLPGVLSDGSAITLRQLLNHTSGLADNADAVGASVATGMPASLRRTWTPQELVDLGADRPRLAAPGASFAYSNTGYAVLGMVVEAVTGEDLGRQLQRRVIGPLRLRGTSFPRTDTRIPGPRLHGYVPSDGPDGPFTDATRLVDVTAVNPSFAWASGALVSTAPDLDRFFTALFTGRLVPAPLLAQMRTTVDASPTFGPGTAYGLGLLRLDLPCGGVAWGHGGNVPGYASFAAMTADASRSVMQVHTLDPPAPSTPTGEAQVALALTVLCSTPAA